MSQEKALSTPKPLRKNSNQELVDVINIDQDETAANLMQVTIEELLQC